MYLSWSCFCTIRGPPESPKQPDLFTSPPKQRIPGIGIVWVKLRYAEKTSSHLAAEATGSVISFGREIFIFTSR